MKAILTALALMIGVCGGLQAGEDGAYVRGRPEVESLSSLETLLDQTLEMHGWTLSEVVHRPDCRVRFVLAEVDTGRVLSADLTSATGADQGRFLFSAQGDGAGPAPTPLVASLEELIATIDLADLKSSLCQAESDSESVVRGPGLHEGSVVDSGASLHSADVGDSPRGSAWSWEQTWVVARLSLFLGLGIFAWIVLGFVRRSSPVPRQCAWPPASPQAILLISFAVGLRLVLISVLPPHEYELENFPGAMHLFELRTQTGLLSDGGDILDAGFHLPLLSTLLDPWFMLGDALGVGGQLVWLRLPNVLFAGWMVLLLLRVGSHIRMPSAGWGAAILFTFLPVTASISAYQGHYFLEMVLCTWFMERLALYACRGRPVHRSLAIAAVAALLNGYLSVLVVVPGLLFYLGISWLRGERRTGLAAALLVVSLWAPVGSHAIQTALTYSTLSLQTSAPEHRVEWLNRIHGHGAMTAGFFPEHEFLSHFYLAPKLLYGQGLAWVALMAFVPLLCFQFRRSLLPMVIYLAFAVSAFLLAGRWVNLAAIFPFLLFLPIWGVGVIPIPVALRGLRLLLSCLMTAALLAGGLLWFDFNLSGIDPGDITARIAAGETCYSVAARIHDPGHEGLPVRVLIFEEGAAYYLCSDRSSKASLQACAQAQVSGDDSAGFRVFEMDGRLVASSRLSLATIGRPDFCPAHEDLLGVHGWCSSDHLVLLSREYFRRERRVESSCRERSLSDRCVVVAVSPDLALYRCPSRGDCVAPGG